MTWIEDNKGRWINLNKVYRIMAWQVCNGYCIIYEFIGADSHFSKEYKTKKECVSKIESLIKELND